MRLGSLFFLAPAVTLASHRTFSIKNWIGYFNGDSGVLQSLSPVLDTSYDFSPSDYFPLRNGVGNYHTGDLTMQWRIATDSDWQTIDSAQSRATSPNNSVVAGSLLHSNFNHVFPNATGSLNITRDWMAYEGDLVLQYTITNSNPSHAIELGAFGFPIEFNNIFTNRTAEETHQKCNLADPYIGLDAGYVQVTRLTGTGPNMVITPHTKSSQFEAWNFLDENPNQPCAYQSQVFEGLYSWQTLSLSYAQNEWAGTQPWNVPTSLTLNKGQSVQFALRFTVAPQVYDIESTVADNGIPVAVGVPGFIVPADMDASLYINSKKAVQSVSVSPAGALTVTPAIGTLPNKAWKEYSVKPASGAFGRARLTIKYADGRKQAVSYYLINTTPDTAANLGDFLFNQQWFNDSSDPFHRSPSVISYDWDAQAQILQEYRAWIAGISDEAGSGSFEAAAMKTSVYPVAEQVHQLEQMVNGSVWGWLQDSVGDGLNAKFGVKRSLFYYQPDLLPPGYYNSSINWNTWEAWDQSDAWAVWRAYDYVHVSALYWGLYQAEQSSPGVLTMQNATWYLLKAYNTVLETQGKYNGTDITAYWNDGLMCETVWMSILQALKAEGLTTQFNKMQAAMKKREVIWSGMALPFGSEMAWDSTGQEGVYLWSKYFGNTALVTKTLQSIRGYMPTVAHWGYNGCARRYWDFLYGGKIARIERMIHHYGSGLNALPMLDSYKYNPNPSNISAIYDLRIGYGGNMGPLSNINSDGFGHEAFHSYADTMEWEAYSGDYGQNFLGHILGACTYLVDHPDFGWISFGGNIVQQTQKAIQVEPKDTVRQRIYVAPAGLAVNIDAGMISSFTYNPSTKSVSVSLAPVAGQNAKSANLMYEDTLGSGASLASPAAAAQGSGHKVSLPSTLTFSVN